MSNVNPFDKLRVDAERSRSIKCQMSNVNLLGIGYLILVSGLFFYSFTQVDLNLTLSQWSIWQVIQKFFQHIGYFERPLSTYFYIAIILLLFIFYFLFLWLTKIGKIRGIWTLIIATTIILTFSYNAFSYDLFNYIFDAKIATFYHQNPYVHKALDFPSDPMLSFMHSTHRPYPYGPIWLLLTVPLSFFVNFFLPTFFIFKTLIALSFLGTALFISKILNKISPHNEVFGLVFFALNPLVIVESLVSSHNDIVMAFFAVLGLYLLVKKSYIFSFLCLFLSIGIKFVTILLLPVFIYIAIMQFKNKSVDFRKVFTIVFILMTIAVFTSSFASGINKNPEIQPWYFLMLFPFAALIAEKRIIVFLIFFVSIAMLASYIPFLLTGEWPKDIVELKIKLLIGSIAVGMLVYILSSRRILSSIKNFVSPRSHFKT